MEEKAVTPVLGTILLITITVGLAAGVGMTIFLWAFPGSSGPNVDLSLRAENVGENVKLTIIHQGGETLAPEDLKVLAEDNENGLREVEMDWPAQFSLGENGTGTYLYGSDPQGKEIRVNVIHDPSRTILLSAVALIIPGNVG